MKEISAKPKIKLNQSLNEINFDFIWIFSNGRESEQNCRSFKHNLKEIFSRKPGSRLVLEKNLR